MNLASAQSDVNVLGLEIRKPVAAYCAQKAKESGLPNVGFLSSNANVDLGRIIRDVNAVSRVSRFSIQFPDPHWKNKHQKRRVVQPELIAAIAEHSAPGCEIFLQGDVLEVVIEMRERFRENPAFEDLEADMAQWIENPIKVPTEREIATFAKGLPVYRALLKRR